MPAVNIDSILKDPSMEVLDIEIDFDVEDEIVDEIEIDLSLFLILSVMMILIAFLIRDRKARSLMIWSKNMKTRIWFLRYLYFKLETTHLSISFFIA